MSRLPARCTRFSVILLQAAAAVVGALAAVPMQARAATPAVQPLDVDALLNMRKIAMYMPIALSPDGELLAFTVTRPPREQRSKTQQDSSGVSLSQSASEIWVADMRTGKSRPLVSAGASWGTAWSGDSRSLAFYSDQAGKARLWVWDRRTDTSRAVAPDRVLSRSGAELQWTPDGKSVLVALARDAQAPPSDVSSERASNENRPTVQVFRYPEIRDGATASSNARESSLSDLALIAVADGRVRRVAEKLRAINALISPDGSHLAVVQVLPEKVAGTFIPLLDLKLIRLADGIEVPVAKGVIGRGGRDLSWSPDGRQLVFLQQKAEADGRFQADGDGSREIFRASLTGEVRQIARAYDLSFKGQGQRPVWSDDGRFIYVMTRDTLWEISIDDDRARAVARLPGRNLKAIVTTSANRDRLWLRPGGRVVVVSNETATEAFHEISLRTGQTKVLLEEQKHYVVGVKPGTVIDSSAENAVASPQRGHLVYVAQSAQQPEDVWIVRDQGQWRPRQLTWLNPEINQVKMGASQLLSWIGKDGLPNHGNLLLPSDYRAGQRYPLVTFVYPVPAAPYVNIFGSSMYSSDSNMQLLATRGYAVLFAGLDENEARAPGEPMQSRADTILPGVDRIIDMGIADPRRLGVIGGSAGGYSTLALIVQTTRFKAAVALYGPGNLLSGYGSLNSSSYSHGVGVAEGPTFRMPGHPWQYRDQYIRNSPWFFLDRVQTPLLLIHGALDSTVSEAQSNEVFNGLRRLEKTVEYARYQDEGHGFYLLANAVDAANRMLGWFDRYLEPGARER